ncbi:LPD29 domain-containing protein [Bacillus altitudinis]|uniref:LPD29 domain-containing protein n=1 Tax=Bacillus altitudinis TaxID=293387 RepID=UPI0011A08E4B|nr:LPD29 domain-containing protein [Bacillus altitudinis]
MTAVLKINEELNGIELYFDNKPGNETLTHLKSNGFRYSGFKKCWWSKRTNESLSVANDITKNKITYIETKDHTKKEKKNDFNLWNATQWTPFDVNKEQDEKSIAKEIKKHLTKRFPHCKFSVTSSYNSMTSSITIQIKKAPYEKKSVYLSAVRVYCEALLNHYRNCYDAADPYTDYAGSYNFYGNVSIDWEYSQSEQTEGIKTDCDLYDLKSEEKANEEKLKKDADFKLYLEEEERRNKEHQKMQLEEAKKIEEITSSIEIKELDEEDKYFVMNSQFANLNKNCTLTEYKNEVEKGDYSNQDVKITKEVHFTSPEAFEYFGNVLMTNFEFLNGTGGSFTEDKRINSYLDYDMMDEFEKRTVKWFRKGVAVYFDGELKFIVDAQGHSYARYVGLVEGSEIKKTVEHQQTIKEDDLNDLITQANTIEDISTSIIAELDLLETWKNEGWKAYKKALKKEMLLANINLSKNIIQQIDIPELKQNLYKLLMELEGIQEQFEQALLKKGEKYTLCYISDLGLFITQQITFDSFESTKYAQYENAVKLVFKPQNKRKLYYTHFYSDLLIFKGWHELPENVLNNVKESKGFLTISSKYHSCDKQQFDEVLNYFKKQDVEPVINTYRTN